LIVRLQKHREKKIEFSLIHVLSLLIGLGLLLLVCLSVFDPVSPRSSHIDLSPSHLSDLKPSHFKSENSILPFLMEYEPETCSWDTHLVWSKSYSTLVNRKVTALETIDHKDGSNTKGSLIWWLLAGVVLQAGMMYLWFGCGLNSAPRKFWDHPWRKTPSTMWSLLVNSCGILPNRTRVNKREESDVGLSWFERRSGLKYSYSQNQE